MTTATPAERPSTELVSVKQKVASVRQLLERAKPQIALALPKHLTVDRMMRIALTAVQRTPQLLDCDQTSLLAAIIQSAQLGLEPDGVLGHAYLIPFRNNRKNRHEVQFIPGYKGLIALARRSGQVSAVEARVVHQKDHFRFRFGLDPQLEHVPTSDAAPGPVTHAYAILRLKDGGVQFEVMTLQEIERVKASSRAKDNGPWVTHPEEMQKKTVLRRALKLAPLSVEVQKAVALDELADAGVPQDLDVIDVPAVDAAPPPSKLDQLTDALEQRPGAPAAEVVNQETGEILSAEENARLDQAIAADDVAREGTDDSLFQGQPFEDTPANQAPRRRR